MASGFCTSEPRPVAIRNGARPSIVATAVISTGRKRASQLCFTASATLSPCSRSSLIKEINTTPFNIATPHTAMKPTDAGTDRYSPVMNSPITPPTEANGKAVKMSAASLTEPNSMNNRKKMAAKVIGTITASVAMARSMFSNCPPQTK